MLKNATILEKFKLLDPWIPSIISDVKKDLKNEHLKKDFRFAKKYFGNKQLNKITSEELVEGYSNALTQEELAESLAEYISHRWLLKHTEVYQYFEDKLREIHPDFTELEEIEKNQSLRLMEEAVQHFGAPNTYLFCVINSVVLPAEVYEVLRQKAKHTMDETKHQAQHHAEQASLANIHDSYQQQIARLTDKYEKKLSGLERKYINDTDTLKRQISLLQKKLNGH